jgi:hypothetical protein
MKSYVWFSVLSQVIQVDDDLREFSVAMLPHPKKMAGAAVMARERFLQTAVKLSLTSPLSSSPLMARINVEI